MQTQFHPDMISADVIVDLVGVAWQTFVGVEPIPVGDVDLPAASVSASISIGGPWQGTVLLHCSRTVAVGAAEATLGIPAAELDEADVSDILGELANILGGNLKGFASADESGWTLSLPVVSAGDQIVPGSRGLVRVGFSCEGEPLVCEVREHA